MKRDRYLTDAQTSDPHSLKGRHIHDNIVHEYDPPLFQVLRTAEQAIK